MSYCAMMLEFWKNKEHFSELSSHCKCTTLISSSPCQHFLKHKPDIEKIDDEPHILERKNKIAQAWKLWMHLSGDNPALDSLTLVIRQ
jgi:hypothetical protein